MFTKLRQYIISTLEKRLGYITIHRRPVLNSQFGRSSFPTTTLPPYAVILRGILVARNSFTLETVLIYKKLFPEAPLIISTLETVPVDIVDALKAIPNVHVVLFKKTSPVGYGHINDQIDSCVAGLTKAQALGAQYALITRVDQRIYATDTYPFLLSLLESFPLIQGTPQQQRIIALGFSTIKYRTYSMNDMFFFGTINDLRLYWDIAHDTRNIEKLYKVGDWIKNRVCEGYLFTTFLSKVGHTMHDSLEDYWEALGKYFILIDSQDLDWYWPKYARYQEYRDRQYTRVTLGEHVYFKDWLIMYRSHQDITKVPKVDELFNDTHNTPINLD